MARSTVVGQLKLQDIFKFCKRNVFSRNNNEGEALLAANQVKLVGQSETNNDYEVKIFALVLQTSSLNSPPHE